MTYTAQHNGKVLKINSGNQTARIAFTTKGVELITNFDKNSSLMSLARTIKRTVKNWPDTKRSYDQRLYKVSKELNSLFTRYKNLNMINNKFIENINN